MAISSKCIIETLPPELGFVPLMACQLTDDFVLSELESGFKARIWVAGKLDPANVTTGSRYEGIDILTPIPS